MSLANLETYKNRKLILLKEVKVHLIRFEFQFHCRTKFLFAEPRAETLSVSIDHESC